VIPGLDLATLHSDAVDYPKTGIKAVMSGKYRIRQWPHFFEKPAEEGSYHSTKILGQLYDMVERVEFKPRYDLPANERIMTAFALSDAELEEAARVKTEYDKAMHRIMAQHEIQTEFEVWSTFVMSHSNNNDYKFHEEIGEISYALKDRFRKAIINSCTDRTTELPRKVAAIYVVTQRQLAKAVQHIEQERVRAVPRSEASRPAVNSLTKEEMGKLPLVSFPWVFPELLVDISRGRTSVARDYSGPGYCDVSLVHEEVSDSQGASSDSGDELDIPVIPLEQFRHKTRAADFSDDSGEDEGELGEDLEQFYEGDVDELDDWDPDGGQPGEEFVQVDEVTGEEETEVESAAPVALDSTL